MDQITRIKDYSATHDGKVIYISENKRYLANFAECYSILIANNGDVRVEYIKSQRNKRDLTKTFKKWSINGMLLRYILK